MTKYPEEQNLVIIEQNDGDGDSDVVVSEVKEECDDTKNSQRENRLTSIIDQLHCQSKMKGKTLFILLPHAFFYNCDIRKSLLKKKW